MRGTVAKLLRTASGGIDLRGYKRRWNATPRQARAALRAKLKASA